MPFSVVAARFDTALHAWWSAFFDHLGVTWLYRPQAFTDASGGTFRPAFWLPHARIWFDADPLRPPPGWQRFACAAAGCTSNCDLERSDLWGEPLDGPNDAAEDQDPGGHGQHDDDTRPDGTPLPLHDVHEAWRGTALFAQGPLPDTYSAAGPWESHPDSGMRTHNDGAYQWTMCPRCDWCGAEFLGRAERLACGCLGNAEEHDKTCNSADPRLLAAYTAAHHAADDDFTAADPDHDAYIDARTPVLRHALVARADSAEAEARCRRACRPQSDDLLHGTHPVAAQALAADLADAQWICLGCDGTVCGSCGANPTVAAGVPCQTCEPVPFMSRRHATRVLDEMAAGLGRRHKVPVAMVHGRLKRVMGVRTRSQASLPARACHDRHRGLARPPHPRPVQPAASRPRRRPGAPRRGTPGSSQHARTPDSPQAPPADPRAPSPAEPCDRPPRRQKRSHRRAPPGRGRAPAPLARRPERLRRADAFGTGLPAARPRQRSHPRPRAARPHAFTPGAPAMTPKLTPELRAAAMTRTCPHCHAAPAERCAPDRAGRSRFHGDRIRDAERTLQPSPPHYLLAPGGDRMYLPLGGTERRDHLVVSLHRDVRRILRFDHDELAVLILRVLDRAIRDWGNDERLLVSNPMLLIMLNPVTWRSPAEIDHAHLRLAARGFVSIDAHAVTVPPLVAEISAHNDLPPRLRQQWNSAKAAWDTATASTGASQPV
ncbi:hypothetical protein GCM10023205_71240 [Yinghuangia aomiensis]|uniref:Uncharacterized protein n=1 Tax=Yinghuangia aomiensis TaxID=676205 RepID=A0ABP9I7K6_9ACTN